MGDSHTRPVLRSRLGRGLSGRLGHRGREEGDDAQCDAGQDVVRLGCRHPDQDEGEHVHHEPERAAEHLSFSMPG